MLYELKSVRKASGMSQAEAAKKLGVPIGTYRNWEQLIYMPRDNSTLRDIAQLFGVSIEALFGYDLVKPGDLSQDIEAEMQNVPVYGRIAAGEPLYMDKVENYFPIPSAVMKQHPHAFLLRVDGESMSNVLPNGCYALVDPDLREPIINRNAYAICVNGYSATIKRVVRLQNGFELVPDSKDPTFKSKIYDYGVDGTEEITVIGEVVWYTVPFDWVI